MIVPGDSSSLWMADCVQEVDSSAVWIQRSTPLTGSNTTSMLACAYSPTLNRAVMVGENGAGTAEVQYTDDGINYTRVASADDATSWQAITWMTNVSLFVAVGRKAGTAKVMTSPDGITWTLQADPGTSAGTFRRGRYSASLGRAIFVNDGGSSTDSIIYTNNGTTFIASATPGAADNRWMGAVWAEFLNLWVVCGRITSPANVSVITSPSALTGTWTSRGKVGSGTPLWNCVEVAEDLSTLCMMQMNQAGATEIAATSTDGINWSTHAGVSITYSGIAYKSGKGFMACSPTTGIDYSATGASWAASSAFTNQNSDICYGANLGYEFGQYLACASAASATLQVQTFSPFRPC